jgi:hypothetical protein
LEAAESHLRLHIRPYFGRRPLGTISGSTGRLGARTLRTGLTGISRKWLSAASKAAVASAKAA